MKILMTVKKKIFLKKPFQKKKKEYFPKETKEKENFPLINDNKILTKEEYEERKKEIKYEGEIVFILKNPIEVSEIVGKIQFYKNNKCLFNSNFFPIDKKLPKMIVKKLSNEMEKKEKNLLDEKKLDSIYFVGKYITWELNSFIPFVEIIDIFGNCGDVETECQALLKNQNVDFPDFKKETFDYLKSYEKNMKNEEYLIPDAERLLRTDLTNEVICTIDPETARDLDDALSINHVKDDIYEVIKFIIIKYKLSIN